MHVGGTQVLRFTCGGRGGEAWLVESWFLPVTRRILEIEFSLSGLEAGAFTQLATLPALSVDFYHLSKIIWLPRRWLPICESPGFA